MSTTDDLQDLDTEQLRDAVRAMRAELAFKQALIDKLTHENALIKRLKFAAKSEAYTAEQRSLLDETCDTDLAALALEIEQQQPSRPEDKTRPVARRCPRTCRVARSATNPRARPAPAAAR